MRPAQATVGVTAGQLDVLFDAGVDWTLAAGRVDLDLAGNLSSVMEDYNDQGQGGVAPGPVGLPAAGLPAWVGEPDIIAVGSSLIQLPHGGVFMFVFEPWVTQDQANLETVQCAITNAAGTTVYAETGPIVMFNAASVQPRLTALVNIPQRSLTAVGEVAYRILQTSGGVTGELTMNEDYCGYILKVGNTTEP